LFGELFTQQYYVTVLLLLLGWLAMQASLLWLWADSLDSSFEDIHDSEYDRARRVEKDVKLEIYSVILLFISIAFEIAVWARLIDICNVISNFY
jgi:hypothetical protein